MENETVETLGYGNEGYLVDAYQKAEQLEDWGFVLMLLGGGILLAGIGMFLTAKIIKKRL